MTKVNLKKATIDLVSRLNFLPNKNETINAFKKVNFPSNEKGIQQACLMIVETFFGHPKMLTDSNKNHIAKFTENTLNPLLNPENLNQSKRTSKRK